MSYRHRFLNCVLTLAFSNLVTACGGGGDASPSASSTTSTATNVTVSNTAADGALRLNYNAASTISAGTTRKIFFEDSTGGIWIGVNYSTVTGAYSTIEFQSVAKKVFLVCTVGGAVARECPSSTIAFNATARTLSLNQTNFYSLTGVVEGRVTANLTW